MHNTDEMQPIKDEISASSLMMANLRKQMKLCEDIVARSGVIDKIVNTIDVPSKDIERKEMNIRKPQKER
jgi:predicted DNA-binding protein YlxM (UPF0122 family)